MVGVMCVRIAHRDPRSMIGPTHHGREGAVGHRSHRGSMSALAPACVAFTDARGMEHSWSRAVATSVNPWQMLRSRQRRKQAKTVAVSVSSTSPDDDVPTMRRARNTLERICRL